MTIQKATKATINLGAIELDCYQMPDGTYSYGYGLIESIIEIDKSILSDKKSPFYLPTLSKGLTQAGKFNQTVSIEGISGTYKWLSEQQLLTILKSLEKLGYEKAELIRDACLVEALERRADAAFGVKRSEQERDAKLKARIEGKLVRRTLTDAIKEYILRHERSTGYRTFVYPNVSDYANLQVLGYKSKQLKELLDLKPTASLRDTIPEKALTELRFLEEMTMRLIDDDDLEPLDAIKKAAEVCKVRSVHMEF